MTSIKLITILLCVILVTGCGTSGALLRMSVQSGQILNSQEVSQLANLMQGEGDLTFTVDKDKVIIQKIRRNNE